MGTGITYQYSSLYVGIFYLSYPATGTQYASVKLTAAGGSTYVECSASAWQDAVGVDLAIGNTSWEWGTSQTYLSIAPKTAVYTNEVFFSALSRYEWGTGTALSVTGAPSGVTSYIVDSNTTSGCQAAGPSDVDCIATGFVTSPATSMTYTWAYYGAFAVAAGIGILRGHGYYAGVYYGVSIPHTQATEVDTTIATPPDVPNSAGDSYFIGVSIWDNADSYDQFGVGVYNGGGWQVSFTTSTCGSIWTRWNAGALASNTAYKFQMSLSGGWLTFDIHKASGGKSVWTYRYYTGGTYFDVGYAHTCSGGGGGLSYQVYEEIHSLQNGNMIQWPVSFTSNHLDNALVPASVWVPWPQLSPTKMVVYTQGSGVYVDNEWFSLALPSYAYSFRSSTKARVVGPVTGTAAQLNAPTDLCTQVNLAAILRPSGWPMTLSPTQVTPSATFQFGFTIPAGTGPGTYLFRIQASDLGGLFTTVLVTVTIT